MAAHALPESSKELGLVHYDAMCNAIAVCHSVDEVKEIRAKARALQVYAKQAQNTEAERRCGIIRLRAERRWGELKREMQQNGQCEPHGGDRKSRSRVPTLKLRDLGVTKDQSSKWEKLADIPEQEFEAELAKPGLKPTTEGLLMQRSKPKPLVDLEGRDPEEFSESTQAQGWLREMASLAKKTDPAVVARGALKNEYPRIQGHIALILPWLTKLQKLTEVKKK